MLIPATVRLSRALLSDIRFWISAVFVAQLFGVWRFSLDRFDAWRQAITAMTARNFLEISPNILFPRIDFAGDLSGIAGMEFPIYNWLSAVLTFAFGNIEPSARILNLLVSGIGIYYFYKSVREFVSSQAAFSSAWLLLFSLWLIYSRKIMPDTFATGLGLIGIYYGLSFVKNGQKTAFLKFLLLMLLAVLAKISVAFMFVYPLLYAHYSEGIGRKYFEIAWATGVVIAFATIWYFWWVPLLTKEYGFEHFFMGRSLSEGWIQIVDGWVPTVERFSTVSLGYVGSALLVLGMLESLWSRNFKFIALLFIGLIAFSPFVVKSGFNFHHHKYYVIPFIPVLCIVAGHGLSVLRRHRIAISVIAGTLFVLEHGSRLARDFRSPDHRFESLALHLNSVSKPNDLIAINSGDIPTPMYFAHRKGWLVTNEQIQSAPFLSDLKARGLKFIVLIKNVNGDSGLQIEHPVVFKNEHFEILNVETMTNAKATK